MKYLKTGLLLWAAYHTFRKGVFTKAAGQEQLPDPEVYQPKEEAGTQNNFLKSGNADIIRTIGRYDNSKHRNMVHIRLDKLTVERLNKFKLATKVDISKLVAFAVDHLFDTQPELISVIRDYINKSPL